MAKNIIEINDYIVPNGWEFYGITPATVKKQLNEADGDVRLDINSGGGAVFAAWEIVNALQDYNKGEVITRITGMAASAAGILYLAGKRREVSDKTYFMAHNAYTITIGDQYELASEADLLKQIDDVQVADLSALTGITERKMRENLRNTYNLIGSKILDAGIATDMVEATAQEPAKPLTKALEEGEGEQQSRLRDILSLQNRGDVKVAAMYGKQKEGILARLKSTLGGLNEVTEKDLQAALDKQRAEIEAENQQKLQQLQQDNEAAVKAEQNRVSRIYQLAGSKTEEAQKAIEANMSTGEFAEQLIMSQREKQDSWNKQEPPENTAGLEAKIPGALKDESTKESQETFIVFNRGKLKEKGVA